MTSSPSPLHVSLVTPFSDLCVWFCEDLGCEGENDQPTATYSDHTFQFTTATSAEKVVQLPSSTVPVMLLRFVDLLSVKSAMDLFESKQGLRPSLVLVYRNEEESDFKMSCPSCGQKLWVRDADAGKKGQCPHCQKSFSIPTQEEHIMSLLSLPSDDIIHRIIRGKLHSFSQPLQKIIAEADRAENESALDEVPANYNATMMLKLDPDT